MIEFEIQQIYYMDISDHCVDVIEAEEMKDYQQIGRKFDSHRVIRVLIFECSSISASISTFCR